MAQVIRENEPLATHTVFKIGGPARFFIEVGSGKDLRAAVQNAVERHLSWVILGAGSNVLVSDQGFPGVVIHPVGGAVRRAGELMVADAAVSMARVVGESLAQGLCGFEWAIGIPGTIGGSVYGNAGCFGSEMKDVIEQVSVFDANRKTIVEWANEQCAFAYRSSIFKSHPEFVVLAATLRLAPGDRDEGQKLVKEFTGRRIEAQDIGSASAGCALKNIPWSRPDISRARLLERFPELIAFRSQPTIPAGFLIDRAGMKGRCVGQACVSVRHANYIVNRGGATAEEVRMLMLLVKEHVRRKYGLVLEEEIRCIGFKG